MNQNLDILSLVTEEAHLHGKNVPFLPQNLRKLEDRNVLNLEKCMVASPHEYSRETAPPPHL